MKIFILIQLLTLLMISGLIAAPTLKSGPTLTKDGDNKFWVDFEVSEYTDVTVSLIDSRDSTVVCHLAGGLLGPKAPLPLVASSLIQHIEWDGKDDFGFLVPSDSIVKNIKVRVRAGMKTKLVNIVGDDPYSFWGNSPDFGGTTVNIPTQIGAIYGMVQGSNGSVFVCGNPGPIFHSHNTWPYKVIRQYDSLGVYVKTIYPIRGGIVDTNTIAGWGLRYRDDKSYVIQNSAVSFPAFSKTILSPVNNQNSPEDVEARLVAVDVDNNLLYSSLKKSLAVGMDGSMPTARTTKDFLTNIPFRPPAVGFSNRLGGTIFYTLLPNKKEALVSGFFHYLYESKPKTNTFPDSSFYCDGQVFKVNLLTNEVSSWLKLSGYPNTDATRATALSGGEDFASIHGTAIDSKERVYVCDRLNKRIGIYDLSAKLLDSIPLVGADNVTVSKSGSVYVAVRTQTASKSVTGTVKIYKFKSFEEGCGLVWTRSISTTVRGLQAEPANMVVGSAGSDTLVWVSYSTIGVQIFKDAGPSITMHKDFYELSKQSLQGYVRLAVDRRNETVYINNGWTGLAKIESWQNPRPVACSTGTKELTGMDMAVSPQGYLYVHNNEGFCQGPIKRYNTDRKHSPANFSNIASNVLTPWVYGQYGGCTKERGLAVGFDNRVAVMVGQDNGGTGKYKAHVSRYEDRGTLGNTTIDSFGTILINKMHNRSGCIRLDRQGNMYLGGQIGVPGRVVPDGYKSDEAYNNCIGTIIKFPASMTTGTWVDSTTISGQSKIYDISTAPFGEEKGGVSAGNSCKCRSPRFDVDRYGRIFSPNAVTCEITVADNEGNLIKKFGSYGNSDDRFNADSTQFPMLWPVATAVSEDYIYIADNANCRMLRVQMIYGYDNMPDISLKGEDPSPMKIEEDGVVSTDSVKIKTTPNPFNPTSHITVSLPHSSRIRLEVYDVTGAFINTIASDILPAGKHHFTWNARDLNNEKVASGTYVYRLRAGNRELYKKVVLAK